MEGMGQGFCDDSNEVLVIKKHDDGGMGLKVVQNCVTSFMDDPLLKQTKTNLTVDEPKLKHRKHLLATLNNLTLSTF